MKSSMIFAVLFTVFSASAYAYTYKCVERSQSVTNRLPFFVTVQEVSKSRGGPGTKYDFIYNVNVKLYTGVPTQSGSSLLRAFNATATSADVIYTIQAWTRAGFNMGIYLDEPQAWMKIKGIPGIIPLRCQ